MQVVGLWNLEKPLRSTGHMNYHLKEEEFVKSREGEKKKMALPAEEQAKPQTQHAEFKKL